MHLVIECDQLVKFVDFQARTSKEAISTIKNQAKEMIESLRRKLESIVEGCYSQKGIEEYLARHSEHL
jgi:hypothetical protein